MADTEQSSCAARSVNHSAVRMLMRTPILTGNTIMEASFWTKKEPLPDST
jgi:hypothetical protein